MEQSHPVKPDPATPAGPTATLVKQTLWITLVAVAVFVGFRNLPVNSEHLHYTDFDAGNASFLELCEPGGPAFVPVRDVPSPVTLELEAERMPEAGQPVRFTVRLRAFSGRLIGPRDLLPVHEERLHLLVVDPSLEDYQHVHPQPLGSGDAFTFEITPRRSGEYRVFADFMPVATGRGLYAGAAFRVPGDPGVPEETVRTETRVGEYLLRLVSEKEQLRRNRNFPFSLDVRRSDGGAVELGRIMGAYAHVVAFDRERSGFAHLHPLPEREGGGPLDFVLLLERPGTYRLWAQLMVDGRELFAPFTLRVDA
ncbi:MAG: hypothetical protein EA425_11590 [Puniceicoccaceae bacterium]|nr:MAG: hypothetical protein EA425_11590 [Puniceicoccaceae bacterium]